MKKEQHILLDMDGVLCNFIQGALDAHGSDIAHDEINDWNIEKRLGITGTEFWDKMKGYDFWFNLKPYPWYKTLYKRLKSEYFDVTIVTSPSNDSECCQAKLDWLKKYLKIKPEDVFVGTKKYLLANNNNILIDDNRKNCEEFAEYGGPYVVFPQKWNGFEIADNEKLDYVLATVEFVASMKIYGIH